MTHKIADTDLMELSSPGLKAFFWITEGWRIDPKDQTTLLGITYPRIIEDWKKSAGSELENEIVLEKETLERISYIVGIYQALHSLLPNSGVADQWIKCPNTAKIFGGKPPLDRMLSGKAEDLRIVREYLDAQFF